MKNRSLYNFGINASEQKKPWKEIEEKRKKAFQM